MTSHFAGSCKNLFPKIFKEYKTNLENISERKKNHQQIDESLEIVGNKKILASHGISIFLERNRIFYEKRIILHDYVQLYFQKFSKNIKPT